MMLAPVAIPDRVASGTPVCVRLIGTLDRALVEGFSDACAGLVSVGRRTLVVSLRDVVALNDENFARFAATLAAYQRVGHEIRLAGSGAWLKSLREAGVAVTKRQDGDARSARRQIIIASSGGRRAS